MLLIFFLITFIGGTVVYMSSVHREQGLIFSPCGLPVFCHLFHLFNLMIGIWYCGWILGIIISILNYFGIIYACFGWVIYLPVSFVKTEKQINSLIKTEQLMVNMFVLIISPIFLIISILTVKFDVIKISGIWNIKYLLIIIIISFVFFILRIVIGKIHSKYQ